MDEQASGSTLPSPLPQGPPVDWTDLPADLVAAICKRLHDLFDSVYFRAVCKRWRTATSISDLPPQFPWVLGRSQDPEHLHVYSLITGKSRTIRCPKARGKLLRGPSHGYLYATASSASDRPIHFLLNPLTNHEVHFELERDFHGRMVCMNPDSMGENNYIAFKRDYKDKEMSFYLPHNREWYHAQLPVTRFNWRSACLNGFYYMFGTDTGNTVVVDIVRDSSFSVPPHDNINNASYPVYFVQSEGNVLSIAMRRDCSSVSSNFNYSFNIYHLDVVLGQNRGYRWVKISSIGNQILFLDFDSGISIAACESETTGLRGNCIYYLTSCPGELFRYNIEDGQVQKICSHLDKFSNWFVPHINGSLSVGSC